jgi:glyoxalase family protein
VIPVGAPEELELGLVIDDREDEPLVADAPDVDERVAIRGMHSVRAYSADPARSAPVFAEVLGMEPEGDARWLAWCARRHGPIVYDGARAEQGIMGAGAVHHVAFTIRDGEQDAWRSRVAAAGLRPTAVLDRKMAKSVYFREPSGVLLEIATDEPGFVFEPPDHLGESLVLIGDLEHRRAELERRLPLLPNPWAAKQTAERTSA